MPCRHKEFDGCLLCRSRKVKCDKAKPQCNNCRRVNKLCPGYGPPFIWVPPNTETSREGGRGGLPAKSTWHGWTIENLNNICDRMAALDDSPYDTLRDPKSAGSLFSVLDLTGTKDAVAQDHHPSSSITVLRPDWSRQQRFLLHHYTDHVAPQMMPIRSPSNPWITHYAALATEHDSVRDAMLSQAAAHLWNLREKPAEMEVCVLNYQSKALASLREMLVGEKAQAFEAVGATILSLIMANVYYGHVEGWRHHLTGALKAGLDELAKRPWLNSEMAWLVAQSVCLLELRTSIDGSIKFGLDGSVIFLNTTLLDSDFLESVSQMPRFGPTLGASRELALCLSKCARVVDSRKQVSIHAQSELDYLTRRLLAISLSPYSIQTAQLEHLLEANDWQQTDVVAHSKAEDIRSDPRPTLQALHDHIFALGLLICLLRSTSNPPPAQLREHAISLFDGVELFMSYPEGRSGLAGPTIWPVFHAAVELFHDSDQSKARKVWLDGIQAAGIGNREQMKAVIEQVWTIRSYQAMQAVLSCSADPDISPTLDDEAGKIVVDWRSVAETLNIDLLLV